jgi:plasmid stabilization system protein ParE
MNEDYDFHPKASNDLEDIWEFHSERQPHRPNRVVADILDTIERLVSFPYQGHRRPDLTSRPLRFTNTRDYLRRMKNRFGWLL